MVAMPPDREPFGPDHYPDVIRIELADARCWSFPAPPNQAAIIPGPTTAGDPRTQLFGADYLPLLQSLREAESTAERLRAELCLAIHLFCLHHELPPEGVQRLFSFPPHSPQLLAAQADFRELANLHLRALHRQTPEPARSQPNLMPFPFSRLWAWGFQRVPVRLLGRSRP